MKRRHRALLVVFAAIIAPNLAQAIPPPDFLFAAGSQLVQVLSIAFVALAAGFAVLLRWVKPVYYFVRAHVVATVATLLIIAGAIGAGAAALDLNRRTERAEFEAEVAADIDEKIARYDVLQADPVEREAVQPDEWTPVEAFIYGYYADIGAGRLEEAYAVSKQNVSFETYRGWYEDVSGTEVKEVVEAEPGVYAIEVVLVENGARTRYGVRMTVDEVEEGGMRIATSQARVLSVVDAEDPTLVEDTPAELDTNALRTLPIAISNAVFDDVREGAFILDAREDEEYEIGHYPGSTHIRFADLLAGSWVGLPTNEPVYVLCWSGIRGSKVAEFLRSKGIPARYLQDGADGWVKWGGHWSGEISFSTRYSEERYAGTLSTARVRELVAGGAVLVDSRDQDAFAEWHIPGSVNATVFYTPTSRFDEMFGQVPAGAGVITICDDFVSCFDAKIAGIKLEQRGHVFHGRYPRPHEYGP